MMLGLPPDTHPRELVKLGRTILQEAIPPRIVNGGPCKENVIAEKDIDLDEFPSPQWNRLDGGRYLITYAGVVTKDPDTGVMNVGIYRGMVGNKNHIPILMWRAQHIGHHVTAWQQRGKKEMPIAVAIGWEPSLGFCAGSPVPKGICEYDVMGAIRGEPVDLVKCETNDLYVPASAEIVIEGMLGLDPDSYMMEGPLCRVHRLRRGRPLAEAGDPRHLHHPPQRSDPARHHRRLHAGQLFRERGDQLDLPLLDRVERARPRRRSRHHRRLGPAGAGRHQPEHPHEADLSRAGQAGRQCDLGSSAAHVRYKHITVVDDDIDIHDYAAVDWAIAYRVNAGRERHRHHAGDVRSRARSLDPQARPQSDAVRHRQMEPRADRRHHQPRLRPRPRFRRRPLSADGLAEREDDIDAAKARWSELGFDKLKR